MNTRGGAIWTATPRPTRHTRALPTADDHRQQKGTIATEGPSRYRRGAAADMRQHTAGHTRRESHTGRPRGGGKTRQPWDRLVSPEAPTMGVKPAATGPAINRDDPGQADLARENPRRTTRKRVTAQHTLPTPVGPARRREWRRTARLMQRAPNKCGLALRPYNP